MIVWGSSSRSLLRNDRLLLNFFSSYVKSNPLTYFQGKRSYKDLSFNRLIMSGVKEGGLGGHGRDKKQKGVTGVWRPVSTQATNSARDYLVKEDTTESNGVQVQEAVKVAEEVAEVTATNNIDHGSLRGESELSSRKHSLSLEVGGSLFRFIRGQGGSTQEKIEEETGVKIFFPSSKKVESIIIEGLSVDSVTRASEMIQAIIDKAVNSRSLDYTHFVSLPLAIHPQLVQKLFYFQNWILGDSGASVPENLSNSNDGTLEDEAKDQGSDKKHDAEVRLKVEHEEDIKVTGIPSVSYGRKTSMAPHPLELRIDKSIFLSPRRFHLTVLMVKLWNKERVNAASEVLKSIYPKVMDALENRPISIRLKGLDVMKGSFSKARVLYVPVEEIGDEGRLLNACQVIINAFVEAGLVTEGDENVKLKLHATVMNTQAKERMFKLKGKEGRFDSFDARPIYHEFGCEEWGEYVIREAHLSQRLVYDDNGYYHRCASIPFPETESNAMQQVE